MKPSQVATLTIVFFGAIGLVLSQLDILSSIYTWIAVLALSLIAAILASIHRSRPSGVAQGAASGQVSYQTEAPQTRGIRLNTDRLLSLLPWLVLVPAVVALLSSVRTQMGPHGYLHSGYVYQILNGHTPPENILMPGTPANYYWYYHALVAAISETTQTAPPLIATLIAFAALGLTLVILYELVGYLVPREKRPIVLIVLAFFSLFSINLFGVPHALLRFSPEGQGLPSIVSALVPQALFGDNRLNASLTKYLGYGGWPLGLLCYTFVLLIVVRALSGQFRKRDLIFAIAATFAAFALHATEGVLVAVAVPGALIITFFIIAFLKGHLLDGSYYKELAVTGWHAVTDNWFLALGAVLLALILAVASLMFLLGASGTTSISLDLLSLHGLYSVFSITYPLIPFFLLSMVFAYRSADARLIFLAVFAIIGFAMGYAINLGNNEYKFTFDTVIAMAAACTVPLWYYVFRPVEGEKRNLLGNMYGVLLLGLMFLNVSVISVNALFSPLTASENFVMNGTHLNSPTAYVGTPYPELAFEWAVDENGTPYPSDLQYADIFQWARANTPKDAILVVPIAHRDTSSLYAISERVPFILDGTRMNSVLPDYAPRIALVEQLYDPAGSAAGRAQALDGIRETLPERSKYLLYPTGDTEISSAPDQAGLRLVYQGRFANLFEIEAN